MPQNPWVEHIKSYADKNGIKYNMALKDPQCRKEYHKRGTIQTSTGGSLSFLKRRPKVVDTALKYYGDNDLMRITVCRKPINSIISRVLNVLTLGALKKTMKKYSYDDLYHLYMIVKFKNGKRLRIEKNQRVDITEATQSDLETKACIDIPHNTVTLKQLFERAERQYKKLYIYTARKLNCQDFMMKLLTASNAHITPEARVFILQDVKSLLPKSLSKIANVATDIAGATDYAVHGGTSR